WVFPAPIIRRNHRWMFDTAAGVEELTARRIGRNELWAIRGLRSLVQAQADYYLLDPDGDGLHAFASRIISSEGKRDGLFWPAGENEDQSPLGPVIAEAFEPGELDAGHVGPRAYHGYYFRILLKQSAAAPGGAMSYFDDQGNLTRGFAVLAWPEEYGRTGVMSFQVGRDGKVMQKDLGPQTAAVVTTIDSFDPTGWAPAE
ncbi:MAG: DUF2950 family protein, partial [Phycisphaerales bacterium]|nr:DUF2950 family protein [Phycisphaerales bacterium]